MTFSDGFDPFLPLDSRWNNSYFWVLNLLEFGHRCFSWFLSLQTWTRIISLDLLVSRLWLQILGLISLIVWDTHTHTLVFPYNNSYFCKVIGMSLLPLLVLVMCNFLLDKTEVILIFLIRLKTNFCFVHILYCFPTLFHEFPV